MKCFFSGLMLGLLIAVAVGCSGNGGALPTPNSTPVGVTKGNGPAPGVSTWPCQITLVGSTSVSGQGLCWPGTATGAATCNFGGKVVSCELSSPAPAPPASPTPAPPTSSSAPVVGGTNHFLTLPPGSTLPDDATCASLVRHMPENKKVNLAFNAALGNQHLSPMFFNNSNDPRANQLIVPRVDGNFTGTTDEILQWAACKWGIDEDIVRGQAVQESWWRQTTLGDWSSDPLQCAPGHGLGFDDSKNHAGACPGSWGILQVRWFYYQSAWPGEMTSTAFNVDTAYAVWRACFEGYELWLTNGYKAGDAWGCVGRWFAGSWHTGGAEGYITMVQSNIAKRIWETPNFQEP